MNESKRTYQAPEAMVLVSRVEQGFQLSGGYQNGREMDWGMTEHIGDAYEVMFFKKIANFFKKLFGINVKPEII